MTYPCPVCGYAMEDPPQDYNICPSCGTEFDPLLTQDNYEEMRRSWVATGPTWWSKFEEQPGGWNPIAQISKFRKDDKS